MPDEVSFARAVGILSASTSKAWTERPNVILRGVPESERMEDVLDTAFSNHVRFSSLQHPGPGPH